MYCKNCGSQIDDDSKFCDKCGQTISKNEENNSNVEQNVENKLNVEEYNNNNNVTNNSSTKVLIIYIIIVIIFIFCGWKFIVQPIFFPTPLQENRYWAENHARQYLGEECRENELTVKTIEEVNGIYIVECTTTNQTLKKLYGSKFYYGFAPNADGITYKEVVDIKKENVINRLNSSNF